ncbi:MAG: hypothetical protein L3J79_12275, partial [Candidatus Marinimicrobia bacterium]|nr:hypothetical protein [Candidatus Neomarinimicrobiota bacterium]
MHVGNIGNFQTTEVSLVADSSGGVIVAWDDLIPRDTIEATILYKSRLTLQRIDQFGNKLWGDAGVRVGIDSVDQRVIATVSDNADGVIVLYSTHTNWGMFPDSSSLRIQRISANGERLWGDNGISVTGEYAFANPSIIPSTDGSAIMYYGREAAGPMFQKINSQGEMIWSIISVHGYSDMISDNTGGVILGSSWHLSQDHIQIVGNRISSEGEFIWGEDGIVVVDSVGNASTVEGLQIGVDSSTIFYYSDAISTWQYYSAFLQVLTSDGSVLFEEPVSPS